MKRAAVLSAVVALSLACGGGGSESPAEASTQASSESLDDAFPPLTFPFEVDAQRDDYPPLTPEARKALYGDTPDEAPVSFAAVGRFPLPNGQTAYVVHETVPVGGIVHGTHIRLQHDGAWTSIPFSAFSTEACGTHSRHDVAMPDASGFTRVQFTYEVECGPEESGRVTDHAYEAWIWTGATYATADTREPAPVEKAAGKAFVGQRLNAFEVEGLACDDLVFVRNAVYAQYGYAFNTPHIATRFESFAGYERDESVTAQTIAGYTTATDQANVAQVVEVEKASDCK